MSIRDRRCLATSNTTLKPFCSPASSQLRRSYVLNPRKREETTSPSHLSAGLRVMRLIEAKLLSAGSGLASAQHTNRLAPAFRHVPPAARPV